MSIARALLLAARRCSAANLPKLGAQQALVAALQSQQTAFPHQPVPVLWRQARGFAAPGGAGGGGDAEKPRQPKGDDEPAAERPLASKVADTEERQAASSAAAAEAGGEPAPLGSGGPSLGTQHPELQQYIQQLKQLKGSSTVLQQEVGDEPAWWQTLLRAMLGQWLQGWIGEFLRTRVEREFEVEEVLEGAKDAYYIVHKLLEEEDWETLRSMMSAKLFAAFQDTVAAYKADGLVWRTAISQDLQAGIRGLAFATKQQMETYDPEQAALAPDDAGALARPAGMWLVLTVQLLGEQRVTITRQEDGQVVAELRRAGVVGGVGDRRPVRWKFARGPLPASLPADRLDADWFLLSI
ncbi:expressed protein [Chlorella variabilis]|uniref:Expressed protein n=1 Tax=Chlorella variabilis TaxID=554065 RepID=E1ZEN2_CHLVA|nr:expressed protein [Chlorella variabilis]EFN55690.1 expressed protein [Chlorella variabilis]|eukprot:XP_005847792.1 expressed protein [Chlorella variabilis]